MASHLSSIGFPVESEQELIRLAEALAPDTRAHETTSGTYLHWSGTCGAELWLQLDLNGALIGINPHFNGTGRLRCHITASVTRDASILDGALHAWFGPPGDGDELGCFPCVFDLPDAVLHQHLSLPHVCETQVTAFAHEISSFPTVQAFTESQAENRIQFASQSAIPTGLFTPNGESSDSPQAYALITGHVLQSQHLKNSHTGKSFYWALLKSLGGTYDIVVDPELLDGPPVLGGVVSGSFWLSGRVLEQSN